MRLPNNPEGATWIAGACRRQCSLDFGWVVRVVINDNNPVRLAPYLEPASGTGELAQDLGSVSQPQAE